MKCRNRNGETVTAYDAQSGIIKFLYGTAVGSVILKLLISPAVSRIAGWFLNRKISKIFIRSFVRKNKIDLSDYKKNKFNSYNEFFCREIRPELRPFDRDADALVSPCDGKLTVCPVNDKSVFHIKGGEYTVTSLLQSKELAGKYEGGTLLLIRLSVDDYHRYSYIADGRKGENTRIAGKYHTVNPEAAAKRRIYKENTREYSILHSENFGDILMMEVGAMMVGRIVNLHGGKEVHRGEEKGYFEFGGSTVILMFEKNKVLLDSDLIRNTDDGYETTVKMGERIGSAKSSSAKKKIAEYETV